MTNIDDIKIKELYLRHLSNPLLAKQIIESNNLETLLVTRPYAFETTDPKLIHVVQEEAGDGEDPEEVTNNTPLVSGLQVSINDGDAVASWDAYPTAQFETTSWRNIVVLCKEEGGQWIDEDEDRTNNSETSYTFHGLNPEYHYAVKTMFEYIKYNSGVWLEGEWSDLVEFDIQDEGISTEP